MKLISSKEKISGIWRQSFKRAQWRGSTARGLRNASDSRTMFHKVEENKKDAQSNLVVGVPTLIMGDFPVYGNQSLETLRLMIKRAIERSA